MANFLKLNKSYLGPEVLSNGSFEEYGPELVTNGDFSSGLSGWAGNDPAVELSIVNDKIRVTNGDGTAAGFTSINGAPTLSVVSGKTYEIKYESFQGTSSNAQSQLFLGTTFNTGDVLGGTKFQTNGIHSYIFTATATQDLYLLIKNGTVVSGEYMEFDNVSVKETGIVERVSNGNFTAIADGTAVTTVSSQWLSSTLSSANVESNILECVSSATNQAVILVVPTIAGAEYRLKIDSVTGDLANNSIGVVSFNVDTTGGSVDFVFTALSNNTLISFYAGDRLGSKQTNYAGISLQATNQFAYGWERPQGEAQEGITFSNSNLTMTGQDTKVYGNTSAYSSGTEVLLKFNVLSFTEGINFRVWTGTSFIELKDLKLGENEFRFKTTSYQTVFVLSTLNDSEDYEITLDSASVQEVVNQPKLIGVDNVSMVSAPTDNTVVINNGLTDGADNLTITYAGASASSRVQMRNFFQDSIIRLANSNNTAEVLEITPPVLITDIVAS
jgi:hypothetical protein